MKSCCHCGHAEAETGMFCRPCNAVLCIMSHVTRHWERGEMKDLVKRLRESSTQNLHESARQQNAVLIAKLTRRIIDLAKPIHMQPDVLKSKVCDAILAEIAAGETIAKHEQKHGEGSYMAKVGKWLSETVGSILGRKSNDRKEAA